MENSKLKRLENDKEILHELVDFLLKVTNPSIEDFSKYIYMINKVETDTFYLNKLEYIDTISLIKKIFQVIDRKKSLFYEYKYIIFKIISKLEDIYDLTIKNEDISKLKKDIEKYQLELENILKNLNKNKKYYYIKVELDNKVPYFYLSRKTIILELLKNGMPYNYTPSSLDDDVYTYFILDYRADENIDINEIFKKLKEEDEAIINYRILKINLDNNLYNIKFFIDKEINNYSCLLIDKLKFVDRIHYENYYDTYVESKNQKYLLEDIFKIDNKEINVIAIKKINEREVKVFLPNGLNFKNIKDIKMNIKEILIDKTISEIIYANSIDFYAYQMLKYLNKRYNIQYTNINR